ncbi:MAG: pimeloyl-ACP methyl ester carboxylesterase [Maricaulis maris]|jgi:pimeloyl-ACP methyl ester carboxylesterase
MFARLLSAALLAATVAACASTPATTVNLQGGDMRYSVLGNGGPVVVFESGLGDGRQSWESVARQLAGDVTVVIYDRPGYGGTPFSDTTLDGDRDGRTGDEVAVALQEMLASANLEGPYILVGHSIGGLYVQSFARRYPEQTAGLVLVDSRPPLFSQRCDAVGAGMCQPPSIVRMMMEPHVRAELDGSDATMADLADPSRLGDLPITVIVATRPANGASPQFRQLWIDEQQAFAAAAGQARYVEASRSRHYIQRDQPDLVIAEIEAMIERVRASR